MNNRHMHKLIEKAMTMRLAGASMASISESTGLSVSTLYRNFKKQDISRGEISQAALQSARERLIKDATFIDNIKLMIAASINDDLALSRQIRDVTALSLEKITYDNKMSPIEMARSLAALSTTMKLTQEIQRRALNIDKDNPFSVTADLPTLTVRRMTDEEIRLIQDELNGDEESLHEEIHYH